MLGLDVHDCAKARTELYVDGTLEAGMVLTVEPVLYFQSDDLTVPEEFRGIGIRIEDDILVTEAGNENLSAGLPRAADEVNAWMADPQDVTRIPTGLHQRLACRSGPRRGACGGQCSRRRVSRGARLPRPGGTAWLRAVPERRGRHGRRAAR